MRRNGADPLSTIFAVLLFSRFSFLLTSLHDFFKNMYLNIETKSDENEQVHALGDFNIDQLVVRDSTASN